MLLDYAAQLKCRTSKRVVSTALALTQLPTDVHHFIVHFSSNAQALLVHLHAELRAITSRQDAKAHLKQNLHHTQQQLRKATALIHRANAVIHHVTREGEEEEDDDDEPATFDPDATLSQAGDDDAQSVGGGEDVDSIDGGQQNLDFLTEQIRQLKEQMAHFAQLQQQATAATTADPHSDAVVDEGQDEAGDIPVAPAFDVPAAPPLTQSLYPSIPIASPMLSSEHHGVPMAPPLLSAAIPRAPSLAPSPIPDAPPLTFSIPIAPPLIPDAPPFFPLPSSSTSSFPSPSPISSLLPIPTPPSRPILSDVTRSRTNLAPPHPHHTPAVYTRNIPGADQLSHTDLIQVAARIKLRRTDIPRSPGGTPCKRVGGGMGGGMGGGGMGGIGEALRMKFRNAHGMGMGGGRRGSGMNRSMDVGSGDKENNDTWNTD